MARLMRKLLQTIKLRSGPLRKRWLSLLFSVLGAGGLILYITRYSSELYRLRQLSVPGIAVLSLLVILAHLLSAMKFSLSARIFGIKFPWWEAFMTVESASLINVVPFSAMGFRAMYLKKVHGLTYVDFGMGALLILVTGFASAGISGLVGLLVLISEDVVSVSYSLLLLFLAYTLGPLVILGIAWWFRRRSRNDPESPPKRPASSRWGKIHRSILDGLDLILTRPRAAMQLFALNILTSLVVGMRFWLIGVWLGYSVHLASGLVLWNVSQATAVFAAIPSRAIGLREAFTGLGTTGLGLSGISGVMISATDRIVTMAWVILLGSISIFVLRHKIALSERRHGETAAFKVKTVGSED